MKTKQLLASLLTLTLALLFSPKASANSAPKFFRGTDAYGAIVTDEDCPITVESELLTFDIPDFPNSGSNPGYRASVTAQYTFYNPADYTVTARLEFPFGTAPRYGTDRNDLTKYDITVNGAAIDKSLRHTYIGESSFEVRRDIARIEDGFTESDFFSPDLPVTKYVYDIGEYDSDSDRNYAAFDFSTGADTRLYSGGANIIELSDGYRVFYRAWSSKTREVYVFGGQFTPKWTFYSDEECKHRVEGEVKLVSSETTTLKALASSLFAEDFPISEMDAYNALVDELSLRYIRENNGKRIIKNSVLMDGQTGRLMRWYEYEITIPPHEKIVNTVTAPIYPDIHTERTLLCKYTYLLSPAQTWADFGKLDIVINTPYFLLDDYAFEKTETGYKASFDGLPDGELNFTLKAKQTLMDRAADLPEPIGLLIIVLIIAFLMWAIWFLIYRACNRKK